MNMTNGNESERMPDDELTEVLRAAVTAVRDEPPPQVSVERAIERARAIGRPADLSLETTGSRTGEALPRRENMGGDFAEAPRSRVGLRLGTPRSRFGFVFGGGGPKWRRVVTRFAAGSMAAAAAVLVIALVFLGTRPQMAWAEVARAMLGQDWIHVTERSPSPEPLEVWLSARHQIKAARIGQRVELFDHRLKLIWTYDPAENTLYRLPNTDGPRPDTFETFIAALPSLLRASDRGGPTAGKNEANSRRDSDQPADRLAFLGEDRAGAELVSEKVESIKDGDKTLTEFTLAVRFTQVPEPVTMTIRVDPATRLPLSWTTRGKLAGKEMVRDVRFDYPASGPADAYALGVPATAKLVDRVPPDDVVRVVEGVRAARQRFDSYHAIVVESLASEPWHQGRPTQIWRKGDRWRMEYPTAYPDPSQQPADNDAAGWWRARVSELEFYPVVACDGTREHRFNGRFVDDEGAARRFVVDSITSHPPIGTKDDPLPTCWSRMPEFLSHPPLGIPRADIEPVLDAQPGDGPAGTVLLRIRRTSKPGAAEPATPDQYRFWIDPARGFSAVRWQTSGGATDEQVYELDEFTRSPQGHWYPTAVRVKNAIRFDDGRTDDQVFRFYLNFAAEFPDSLFSPGR